MLTKIDPYPTREDTSEAPHKRDYFEGVRRFCRNFDAVEAFEEFEDDPSPLRDILEELEKIPLQEFPEEIRGFIEMLGLTPREAANIALLILRPSYLGDDHFFQLWEEYQEAIATLFQNEGVSIELPAEGIEGEVIVETDDYTVLRVPNGRTVLIDECSARTVDYALPGLPSPELDLDEFWGTWVEERGSKERNLFMTLLQI